VSDAPKITAWRYVPGKPLHPAARAGLPSCQAHTPSCERCDLSITAVVLGFVCVLNPGEWLVVVADQVALVMPDNMFRLVQGSSAIAADGELVDPSVASDELEDLDALLEAAP
jgi:hypothetical protein